MATIAGLKDFRKDGVPSDVGLYQLSATAMIFQFTFSGATYVCAIQTGISGWVSLGYTPIGDDQVEAQAAVTYLQGLGGGELLIREGEYTFTEPVTVTASNVKIRGVGRATLIHNNGGGEDGAFFFEGALGALLAGCVISDMRFEADSGVGDCVTFSYCEKSSARNLWCLNTDQPNETFEEGIIAYFCIDILIEGCIVDGAGQPGIEGVDTIHLTIKNNICRNGLEAGIGIHGGCTDVVIEGNQCIDNLDSGIFLYPAIVAEDIERVSICDNICTGNGERGIYIINTLNEDLLYITIKANFTQGNTLQGIFMGGVLEYGVISGNISLENGGDNISASVSFSVVMSSNIAVGSTGDGGINLYDCPDSTVTGNISIGNWNEGIGLTGTSHLCACTGNLCKNNGQRGGVEGGIYILSNSNIITGNSCYDDQGAATQDYGINCGGDLNTIKNNYLGRQQVRPIADNGLENKYATKIFQFTRPLGQAVWQDVSPAGIVVDAAAKGVLALGEASLEVQQIVKFRVKGVCLGATGAGKGMLLEINVNAGKPTGSEAYNAEAIAVASVISTEDDVAVDDAIEWIIDASDDTDVDEIEFGETMELFAMFEDTGADGDIATNAVIRTISIEYV